jgi:predicted naringenin-chalcone synthase
MSLAIAGIGTAVPEHHRDQDFALSIAQQMCGSNGDHDRRLRAIYKRSGVTKRHSVLEELSHSSAAVSHRFYLPERGSGDRGPSTQQRMARYEAEVAPLATKATRRALEEAGIGPESLTHLISVSCTGFNAPGFDLTLIHDVGLPPQIARTHIGFMGCHGSLNGLRVARSFLEADSASRVLLCAAELCTLHLYFGWDEEKVIANALFADGAAALVAVPSPVAPHDAWRVVDNASTVLEDTGDLMSWRVGDHGFEMTLSRLVPTVIEQQLKPWLVGWLETHELSIPEIGSWAIHPGGPKIITSVANAAGLSDQSVAASQEVLAEFGNMSSPTVLFILQRLKAADAPRPCVAMAFGPGLAVEGVLIR